MNQTGRLARIKGGNWGLKLLALAIAVVIYYAVKSEYAANRPHTTKTHGRNILNTR